MNRRQFLQTSCLSAWLAKSAWAEAPLPPPVPVFQYGSKGPDPGQMYSPIGLVIDAYDQVYVTEFRNERVQKFRIDGTPVSAMPVQKFPGGIAVAPDGRIAVAHWNANYLGIYSEHGQFLSRVGEMGTGDGQFRLPGGLVFAKNGELYACDQGNSRIQVFDASLKFSRAFGTLGAGPGQFGQGGAPGGRFSGPQWVVLDRREDVFATDTLGGRVVHFRPNGEVVEKAKWNGKHKGPGGFLMDGPPPTQGPIGLVVDREDNIWVSATNHAVQQFSPTGELMRRIGSHGEAQGQFKTPHAMAFDRRGHLHVVDTMNHRVQVLRIPKG